jgi:hypothetical protein
VPLKKGSFSYGLIHLLLSLLQQFIPPVSQLHGNLFDVVGLFDGPRSNVPGILVAQFRVRQLHDGVSCVIVDALAEHFQNFHGGA